MRYFQKISGSKRVILVPKSIMKYTTTINYNEILFILFSSIFQTSLQYLQRRARVALFRRLYDIFYVACHSTNQRT